MTNNRMRRRRLRRSRAVRHCLDRYHQQVRIEEELSRLPLPRSDSLRGAISPFKPLHPLGGRICGLSRYEVRLLTTAAYLIETEGARLGAEP